jgi:hypothetical protein
MNEIVISNTPPKSLYRKRNSKMDFRCNSEIKQNIFEMAQNSKTSMTNVILDALELYFDKSEGKLGDFYNNQKSIAVF